MAKIQNSKIDTLPADLKLIAEEMLEAKFPSPKKEMGADFHQAATEAFSGTSHTGASRSSRYTRLRLRGYDSGQDYYAIVDARDIATHGLREAVAGKLTDMQRIYKEPMRVLEAETDGHIRDYAQEDHARAEMLEFLSKHQLQSDMFDYSSLSARMSDFSKIIHGDFTA